MDYMRSGGLCAARGFSASALSTNTRSGTQLVEVNIEDLEEQMSTAQGEARVQLLLDMLRQVCH